MSISSPTNSSPTDSSPNRALVLGFGASGAAAARHLIRLGANVVVVEDTPTDDSRRRADEQGLVLVEHPDAGDFDGLIAGIDVLVVSPGVPESHGLLRAASAAGVPVWSEIELAYRSLNCPIVAVTGTNGKTSVVTMVTAMLNASGRRAVAAGNIGLALCDVVDDVANDTYEIVVAEVSSFQLRFTDTFSPKVAVWLNVAPDHLDWHPDFDSYIAAKALIWSRQTGDDIAVANIDDPAVMAEARSAPSPVITFGSDADGSDGSSGEGGAGGGADGDWAVGDWAVVDGVLRGPSGLRLDVGPRLRAFPHERANAAAAAAAALAGGATPAGIAEVLANFEGLAHRLTLVSERDGVAWYDDSKATNPAAAVAAIRAFNSVVLIAGGRNKGLDLGTLSSVVGHIRAVVAIGEAADDVDRAFAGERPVRLAGSMDDAVRLAGEAAYPGDAVLLSPACASFDWYRSYAERGDDFSRSVRHFLETHIQRGTR